MHRGGQSFGVDGQREALRGRLRIVRDANNGMPIGRGFAGDSCFFRCEALGFQLPGDIGNEVQTIGLAAIKPQDAVVPPQPDNGIARLDAARSGGDGAIGIVNLFLDAVTTAPIIGQTGCRDDQRMPMSATTISTKCS